MVVKTSILDQGSTQNTLKPEDLGRLEQSYLELGKRSETMLGYPCNAAFDYSPLYRFLNYRINNIGDPFVDSNYKVNTHEIEREVISYFRNLTSATEESVWGYVTNGGTEGNMYGLFLARELYPSGIVYFSEDTHYSVTKILRLLHVRNIMIKSQPNGEMDYEDLEETIRIHRDVPAIVFANIGSTMKGAVDDLDKIKGIIKKFAIQKSYIHCDAALSGMILPHCDNPQPFDFSAGIDSMSISGHKFIGSPIPCGIALAKKEHVSRIARGVEYVGILDTTLTGSRNGIAPLFLWYAIKILAHFLIGLFAFLILGCMSCLYILKFNYLPVVSFSIIFSHF